MIKTLKKHSNYTKINNLKQNTLKLGTFGFKALEFKCLTKEKLITINFLISRKIKLITIKKNYKIWNQLLLNQTLTKLSSESRMGKGKGTVITEFTFVRPGTIIFEFDNINKQELHYLYNYIKNKLSIKLSLISRK